MTERDWLRYDELADKMDRIAHELGKDGTDTADLTIQERREWHQLQRKLDLLEDPVEKREQHLADVLSLDDHPFDGAW